MRNAVSVLHTDIFFLMMTNTMIVTDIAKHINQVCIITIYYF